VRSFICQTVNIRSNGVPDAFHNLPLLEVTEDGATPVSSIARVITRFVTNGLPANAVSFSLSYAGSGSGQIPEELWLWNLPLYEEHEDGSTSLWFYAFGNYNSETHSFAENADGLCLRSVQAATEKKL